jgi:hypothetical protein
MTDIIGADALYQVPRRKRTDAAGDHNKYFFMDLVLTHVKGKADSDHPNQL